MRGKIVVTFLLHIVGLVLLLIPNQFQGQVVTRVLGVPLRTLDVAGIVIIIAGSVFLNIYLFGSLSSIRKQIKQINQMPRKDETGKIK